MPAHSFKTHELVKVLNDTLYSASWHTYSSSNPIADDPGSQGSLQTPSVGLIWTRKPHNLTLLPEDFQAIRTPTPFTTEPQLGLAHTLPAVSLVRVSVALLGTFDFIFGLVPDPPQKTREKLIEPILTSTSVAATVMRNNDRGVFPFRRRF